jgi:hypothetical protein
MEEADPASMSKRIIISDDTKTPTNFRDTRYAIIAIPDETLVLQAAQKDSEARRAKNRRAEAYLPVRWSEAIERNEAYESF